MWLKKERPKHAIYPHKVNYCDTCAKQKKLLRSKQTILNRIRHTGSAEEEQQKSIEDEMAQINEELKIHQGRHNKHMIITKRQQADAMKNGKKFVDWKPNTIKAMMKLRNWRSFTAVLSVDFQM